MAKTKVKMPVTLAVVERGLSPQEKDAPGGSGVDILLAVLSVQMDMKLR